MSTTLMVLIAGAADGAAGAAGAEGSAGVRRGILLGAGRGRESESGAGRQNVILRMDFPFHRLANGQFGVTPSAHTGNGIRSRR